LTICFSISNDSTSGFCGYTEANKIENEISDTHVNCIPVKHELTIVRPGSRSFHKGVAYIGNTDPNTADKIQQQIDSLSSRNYFFIQLLVIDYVIIISPCEKTAEIMLRQVVMGNLFT
jgi:hypothetical protein